MGFVVFANGRVGVEVVIGERAKIQPGFSGPLYIPALTPILRQVVDQGEQQPDPMSCCFRNHKIKCLHMMKVFRSTLTGTTNSG